MANAENQIHAQNADDEAGIRSKSGNGAPKQLETTPNTSTTSVQHPEPEDAYLTGGQRNLQRRVLGLNVEASHQPPVDQSAGLHSTGSFTGTANDQTHREEDK